MLIFLTGLTLKASYDGTNDVIDGSIASNVLTAVNLSALNCAIVSGGIPPLAPATLRL